MSEFHICATCLLVFRRALNSVFEKFKFVHFDCLTELYERPNVFCQSDDELPRSIEFESPVQKCCIELMEDGDHASLCASCLVHQCLHCFRTNLDDGAAMINTSLNNVVIPVGVPLIMAPCLDKKKNLFEW